VTHALRHGAAFAGFALLVVLWLLPVVRDPTGLVPGPGAGDNLTFVWNTWWMRHALDVRQSPLWTDMLFAPWGSSLALNTHTALPSLAAALLLPLANNSTVAATNGIVALHLLLNFVAGYGLAYYAVRHQGAALVAAAIFGLSPYIGVHLQGHFNLIAAWVLPLAALTTIRLLDRPETGRAWQAGLAWGAIVYVDYYYTTYAAAIVLLLVLARSVRLRRTSRIPLRWQRIFAVVLGVLLAADLILLVTIALTGGTSIAIGGRTVSIQGLQNPTAVAGVLVLAAVLMHLFHRWALEVATPRLAFDLRRLVVPAAVATLIAAPVLIALARLWLNGDYTSQRYLWRSAPAGIDLATLLLGNPNSALIGDWTRRAYAALGIDAVERVGWIGPAVIVLAVMSVRNPRNRSAPAWLLIAATFGIWSLGPYLLAAGRTIWVLLPATLIRFIPLVSNARIPSRAMVVVYLALAVLAAFGWLALRDRKGGTGWRAAMLVLLAIDLWPAHPLVHPIDRPAAYDALRAQPEASGVLCELPMGLRDGFGEIGRLDTRVLLYQAIHGRPITGGFVARLGPRTQNAFERDPILGPLLRLSGGAPLDREPAPDRKSAGDMLARHGIRYVMVNRITASPALLSFVAANLPLRAVAEDQERTLYAVEIAARGSPPSVPTTR
jgi:hypothetical protein